MAVSEIRRRRRRAEDRPYFKGMGLAIISLREERGLTQADLASRSELSTSSLRQIEHGTVDAHWGTLRRLASALDTPLDALTELAEERAPGVGRAARRGEIEHCSPPAVPEEPARK